MPSRDQFVGTLLEFPMVQGLRMCARRLKVRLALRGGVLRNHLFTLVSNDRPAAEFCDYIDPFSDIDLVLEGPADWPRVAQAISESLPFSGFHRWEVVARDALYETSKQFASIAPDRLLVWFDGRSGDTPDITIDGLGVNAEETIRQPFLSAKSLAEKSVRAPAVTDILDLLRLARYSFAFPRIAIDFEPQSLLERINAFSLVEPLWRKRRTARSDLRRLEVALLNLIFTAHNWDAVVSEHKCSSIGKSESWLLPHREAPQRSDVRAHPVRVIRIFLEGRSRLSQLSKEHLSCARLCRRGGLKQINRASHNWSNMDLATRHAGLRKKIEESLRLQEPTGWLKHNDVSLARHIPGIVKRHNLNVGPPAVSQIVSHTEGSCGCQAQRWGSGRANVLCYFARIKF